MTKRVAAAFLWFYTGWYAGAFLAEIFGVSPVIGPIIGVAAAGLLVGDPLRIIWTRPAPKAVMFARHSANLGIEWSEPPLVEPSLVEPSPVEPPMTASPPSEE